MDSNQLREEIFSLHRSGHRSRFLDLGWRYLSALPADPEVAVLALNQCLDWGLGGPVRELLQARSALAIEDKDHAALHKRLAQTRSGRVAWSELKAQYQANLTLLRPKVLFYEDLERQLAHAIEGLHLFQTLPGKYLLSRRKPGRVREWLPYLTDYDEEAHTPLPALDDVTGVFVGGFTLGPLVERIHQASAQGGLAARLPLFLVDDDLGRLAAWLHTADRSRILGDDRVLVFAGSDAVQNLETFLDEHRDIARSSVYVTGISGLGSICQRIEAVCQRVQQRCELANLRIQDRLRNRYAGRDLQYCRARLARGGSVLGITSRRTAVLQYATRDIGRALGNLGYEFHMLIESSDLATLTTLEVGRKFEELDPVLIVLVDHFRYEYKGILHNVPVLTWVQDPLSNILCRQAGESIGPLDFVCGFYKSRCVEEFGYPSSRFYSVPFVPVSTKLFHDGPVSTQTRRDLECDVCYVGHMPATPERHLEEWKAANKSELHPFLDDLYQQVLDRHHAGEHLDSFQARELLSETQSRHQISLKVEMFERVCSYFIYYLFDLRFRAQTLQWVSQWAESRGRRFKLYGRGWETHPTLSRYACGPVEHGEPLRRVYYCCRLAIQTLPGGFMHPRSFEALTSGCLVLSRYAPPEFLGFKPAEFYRRMQLGESLEEAPALRFCNLGRVVFADAHEFATRADQFLKDETLYQEVLREFRRVVLQKYTYVQTVQQILSEMQSAFADQPVP